MLIAASDRRLSPLVQRLTRAVGDATPKAAPFRHWLLDAVLGDDVARGMAGLPLALPGGRIFDGKRDTNNSSRLYFAPATARLLPAIQPVMDAFQAPETVAAIEARCGIGLAVSSLRIEYAQDTDGFWLQPHTDLGVKLVTMLIYLSSGPGHEDLGTDLYEADRTPAGRAPARFGSALLFVPSHDTWHGFEPRPIRGVRRSLIVNYVTPAWRARTELAFPDHPVR